MRLSIAVVWLPLAMGGFGVLAAACNDEKKPPLTPDGPEMTTPVGGSADGGTDLPPPAPPAPPTPPTPPK